MLDYSINPLPERDAYFRNIAGQCYTQLLNWISINDISKNSQLLTLKYDDGRQRKVVALPWTTVNSQAKAKEHPLHNFVMYFGIKNHIWKDVLGAFGPTQQGELTLSIHHILDDYDDIKNLENKLQNYEIKSIFIHEFIHLLDYLRRKGPFKGSNDLFKKNYQAYITSPIEFNAYYQQGFHALDTYLNRVTGRLTPEFVEQYLNQHPEFQNTIEDKLITAEHILTWDFVRFNLEKFWQPNFIYYLKRGAGRFSLPQDKKMWKRFLKRLSLDFKVWKDKHIPKLVTIWKVILEKDELKVAKNPLSISQLQRENRVDEKVTFVATMRPEDFIYLTEAPMGEFPTLSSLLSSDPEFGAKPLAFYNELTDKSKIKIAPMLVINIENDLNGYISAHEGRHRAAALIKNNEHIMEVGIKLAKPSYSRNFSFLDCPVFWKAQFRPERNVDAREILFEIKEANIQQQYQKPPKIKNISLNKDELIKILSSKINKNPRKMWY